MPRLTETPVRVSLPEDDPEAIRALRDVMRTDEPYFDEPPLLEDFDDPLPWLFFRGPLTSGELDALGWMED